MDNLDRNYTMESQQPLQGRSTQHPKLHTIIPPTPANFPQRTANSTPMSSPGLFSPSNPRPKIAIPTQAATDANMSASDNNSHFLHPLQNHKVRETHKALVDLDFTTGRKLINQYEVIEEIGRGMHGKVKLARDLETGDNVAIKIIPRFSKKRRLGKVTAMSPQDKTKKEIAILKKIRHPNVVALLEVIDDPELKKIYMVLEHVELGEIVWRKKGLPHICAYERRRIEREMRGDSPNEDVEQYSQLLERRQALKDLKRAKISQSNGSQADFWSIEYGAAEEEEPEANSHGSSRCDLSGLERIPGSMPSSVAASRATSRAPSRTQSVMSMGQHAVSHKSGDELSQLDDVETPAALRSNPASATALEGTMYGPYVEDPALRGRSPSVADSIISHMSSLDFNPQPHDPFADDFSYVPCFTIDQARTAFRDTVLGLEYLHYQGVVHRDIKPANLLWTKDHRVKISDFGVSYFGRPIRDGEPDDMTSESEARDFDDDLELSKTVGTPAFFAPELCYTDLDKEQPKISEQIDVWSLGVTLYCLIYARIPFPAEDEYQMWKKIATEDVYIPRSRLRPVDPSTAPNTTSLFHRQNSAPYRDDNELLYEDIDNLLYDLLRLMLTKNPEKRIRLRDIKRHPWVVQGIGEPVAWLDDTDPARPSSGRRIQVDEREMSHAVVPITFLERARSVVKKAVGKVIHPLSDRAESKPRVRATSSVASLMGESSHHAPTPPLRDSRRKSLKDDDYFAAVIQSEHPLSQSVTAMQRDSPASDVMATAIRDETFVPRRAQQQSSESLAAQSSGSLPAESEAMPPTSPHRRYQRHSHTRSSGHCYLPLTPSLVEAQTMPATPSYDGKVGDTNDLRKARDTAPALEDSSRSRSVDRGLFANTDKRAEPKVALSTAVAPGNTRLPKHPRPVRSIDLGKANASGSSGLASPLLFSLRVATGSQNGIPKSDPNVHANQTAVERDRRPKTVHRVENIAESRSHPSRQHGTSTPEPYARTREPLYSRHTQDEHAAQKRRSLPLRTDAALAGGPCLPSPGGESAPAHQGLPSREQSMTTAKSSSSTSFGALTTPLTSPSEITSPVSTTDFPSNKTMSQQMLAFQSDPSLPALLSGASSVSNDIEGELLGQPGVVSARPALPEDTDSLTPRAMAKETTAGYAAEQGLEAGSEKDSGIISVRLDAGTPDGDVTPNSVHRSMDEDDDSDSDEGLTMMKTTRKKKPNTAASAAAVESLGSHHRTVFTARRRDTNASIASTETAKKVAVHGSEEPATPPGA